MTKLERNDVRSVIWRCNVKLADRIFNEKFRARYLLNSVREYLQDGRLGHAVSMEGSAWSSKWQSAEENLGKHWVRQSEMRERKVSKNVAKNTNTWNSFTETCHLRKQILKRVWRLWQKGQKWNLFKRFLLKNSHFTQILVPKQSNQIYRNWKIIIRQKIFWKIKKLFQGERSKLVGLSYLVIVLIWI